MSVLIRKFGEDNLKGDPRLYGGFRNRKEYTNPMSHTEV